MVTVSRLGVDIRLEIVDMILVEINLNGGIVVNKGFIEQMSTKDTDIIDGKYISAWGGIQSAGQFFGQVVCHNLAPRTCNDSPVNQVCSFYSMPRMRWVGRLPSTSSGLTSLW